MNRESNYYLEDEWEEGLRSLRRNSKHRHSRLGKQRTGWRRDQKRIYEEPHGLEFEIETGTRHPASRTQMEELLEPEVSYRKSRKYIRWVQRSLNRIMGLSLAVDGRTGRNTRDAIRSFQRTQGLKVDGEVGTRTEAAIRTELAIRLPDVKMVNPKKVDCEALDRSNPVFTTLGTDDPTGELEKASQRAVQMLDNTITEMRRIRERVRAGEPPAWPLLGDIFAWSLRNRMLMHADRPSAWTGTGPRTAEQVIRWLRNIRNTIGGGFLHYTCLDTTFCGPGTWAWVYMGKYHIRLCRSFWRAKKGVDAATHLEYRAQTLIHEVSHIYYNTDDKGRGAGHAECVSQFVAEANDSPVDPDFARFCGLPTPG
jgi:hypothetical protein